MQQIKAPALFSTSTHQLLRSATQSAHAQIEAHTLLARLLAADLELTEYADILFGFRCFFQHFEARLATEYGVHQELSEYQYRSRIPLLDYDLRQLTSTLPHWLEPCYSPEDALAITHALPKLTTVPQQLGAFYVIEGASQGGRIITKRLAHQFINTDKIATYFNYWQTNPDSWCNWQRCAAAIPLSHSQQAEAVQAARSTFFAIECALAQRRHN
ncbi:biliverdin-producing heme oxygenase [Aliidiomarina sp.]|uniref:biliverdin-producing heme oxygenase n=1 Tax=Aliidiomarina sp. TaxID=1872439 RepID=UPI003A4DA5D0